MTIEVDATQNIQLKKKTIPLHTMCANCMQNLKRICDRILVQP